MAAKAQLFVQLGTTDICLCCSLEQSRSPYYWQPPSIQTELSLNWQIAAQRTAALFIENNSPGWPHQKARPFLTGLSRTRDLKQIT
jgi:hypothetical protein